MLSLVFFCTNQYRFEIHPHSPSIDLSNRPPTIAKRGNKECESAVEWNRRTDKFFYSSTGMSIYLAAFFYIYLYLLLPLPYPFGTTNIPMGKRTRFVYCEFVLLFFRFSLFLSSFFGVPCGFVSVWVRFPKTHSEYFCVLFFFDSVTRNNDENETKL